MKNNIADYVDKDGEWRVCEPLNKDCEEIVNDLVNSAGIAQNWSKEKKEQYFHRAISMACDMATKTPKNAFRKRLDKIVEWFFCLTSKLVIYVR